MKKRILKVVLGLHFIWLILSIILYNPEAFFRPKQKIKVNTVVLSPPPPPATKVVAVVAPRPKPKAPAANPPPAPQKKVVRKTVAKPTPKQDEAKRLLTQIEKSLDALETQKTPPKIAFDTPKTIEKLQIDQIPDNKPSYSELLMASLQETLILPEIGEVKIKLTLKETGELLSLEVIHSSSEKNRLYLESELARQIFPPLNHKKSESFILTFCNRES